MDRFSDLTRRIAGRTTNAWHIYHQAVHRQMKGERVINLAVGDPDLETPDLIKRSAKAALDAGYTHYEEPAGNPILRQAIAAFQSDLSGQSLAEENICVFSGGQNALFAAALCLFDAGDEVIAPDPCYVTYEGVIRASGAQMVQVPLDAASGFSLDIAAMESAITPKTRGLLVNFPNNPTGAGIGPDEARELVALARRHDLWIISDEVYATILFDGDFTSPTHVADGYDKIAVVNSMSKSHAMTGWRVGWLAGPADLILHVTALSSCMIFGCASFSQQAALTALTEGLGEIETFRQIFKARRDAFCDILETIPGLGVFRPVAGMFIILDIAASGLSPTDFAQTLLDEHDVAVLPGPAFGDSLSTHVRVSLMADEQALKESARKIGLVMSKTSA
ncbi:pyridoxal phosphate-dependent aminotransferase [Coralliovum pocilloporae]|uniref:pyridoxal phosphate-dependent aminotransferase n=1 Tax=Coralliovum pocilloporae TaxID=3066369 RepID=UPI00330767AF